jgi:hypothetical protein
MKTPTNSNLEKRLLILPSKTIEDQKETQELTLKLNKYSTEKVQIQKAETIEHIFLKYKKLSEPEEAKEIKETQKHSQN